MKYVIVDRDGCNVYGVFKTEKEAGQWIFDNLIKNRFEVEDYEHYTKEDQHIAMYDFDMLVDISEVTEVV